MAHSTLGPSQAKRWINCPGSVALAAKAPPSPNSVHAAEGTVAHKIAEEYVTGKIDFLEMTAKVGETVKCDGFDIEITEEMVDGAVEYRDLIDEDRKKLEMCLPKSGAGPKVVGEAEVRVHAGSVDERVWGTSDYILHLLGRKVIVYDYKFGKGVIVDVEDNEQGMLYLQGVLEKLKSKAFNEMEIVIHQPRAPHVDGTVRRWVVPKATLEKFVATAKAAAAETLKPNAKVVAGDWCRWCPAKAFCPAMHKAAAASAMVDFADPVPSGPVTLESRLPEVRLMSDEQLVAAFGWEETVNSFFETVKEVLRERLSSGVKVPGVKLVEGRSNRQYVNEDEVVTKFEPVLGEKLWEKKLLSPAKLEKIVGKKAGVDGLTFKPEGKKSIALDRDPRPEAKSSAQDDFGVLEAPNVDADLAALFGETQPAAPAKREPLWPV